MAEKDDTRSTATGPSASPAANAPAAAVGEGSVDSRLREALRGVTLVEAKPSDLTAAYSDAAHQAELRLVELNQRRALLERDQQFTALRGHWSRWLIGWISLLLVFHITLTFCIGFGWLNFRDYQWYLPMVVAQNFLQIVGMGVVVVQFLYPGGKTDTPPPVTPPPAK